MATKPSPSWPPFRPETPDQRSNSFQSYFSFAESFNEPRYLFPDAATGLPAPSHVERDPDRLLLDSALRLVQLVEPSFRVSPLPPTATLAIARYFGKKRFSRRRAIARANRGGTAFDRPRPISTVNGRARFGNRAGSYLSCQLRIRCARHRCCNYFAVRSVNTPATDSRSIRGVNLSKALASARHSEYHLNALSVAAYTRLRSRVNAGRGIGRRRRWRGPVVPRQLRRTPRTPIDARSSASRGPTTRSSFARWIDLRAGEGVVFFHGQRRPTFFGRKTIGSGPGRGSRDESVGDIDWRATGAARSVGPSVVSLRVARMFLGRWIGGRALMHIQRHSQLLRHRRERTTPAFPTHPLVTPIRRSRERDGTKTRR